MKIEQMKFSKEHGWQTLRSDKTNNPFNLVLAFGSHEVLNEQEYNTIRKNYPDADIVMSSTAGEIIDTEVCDNTISLTAICLEKTVVKTAIIDITEARNSFDAGRSLGKALDPAGLKNVLIISDGQKVNGSDLVLGLQETLPPATIITGGLAGDGARFQSTLVGLNNTPSEGKIVAIGFYGAALTVTYGSVGGWDVFGPERLITRSDANVLYELDGEPALDIYKLYLGDYANELPGSGLLFPLSIRMPDSADSGHSVVRTILGVNEEHKSLIFAGNMPVGTYTQLMKASLDRLIEGAADAAQDSIQNFKGQPDLAILISCVGRKLVLDQRIEEEVEVVKATYGNDTAITGFYSYGEISPSLNSVTCDLHNQTMTITTLTER
jgi:hypothetical protein